MSDKQPFTPPCPLHTAVLFLIYKRPDTTRQVFEAIRQAKPPRLYVAADGPKDVPGEAEKVQQARDIVLNGVDWDCEVKTLFRDTNMGCKYGVSGGITWFFEHEEEGIILEDDTLPSQSFFWFCQELLERYRDDKRVMCIAALNSLGKKYPAHDSYFFSRYNHCWGWATWSRAWKFFSVEMQDWPRLRDSDWLAKSIEKSRLFITYWREIFESTYQNRTDSWAYIWTYVCWKESGLTILPQINMIKNIGFSESGTHTTEKNNFIDQMIASEMSIQLHHPLSITRDIFADGLIGKYYFEITFLNFIKVKIRKGLFGGFIYSMYKKCKYF